MTREQKQAWLEKASAREFLAHYNSTIRRYTRLMIGDADFHEVMEDWHMAETEMKKRLGA